MSAKVIKVEQKNARTVAVTIEGPDRESVNDTRAKQLALEAAATANAFRPAVRRMNGTFPFHPDGTQHQGNDALPDGSTWRQTFELESGL